MKALKFIATLLLISITTTAYAQVPPGLQGDYSRMMSNMSMNMAGHMSMMRMLNYMNGNSANYVLNLKHDFRVVMKDGTIMNVKSKIYADTIAHSNYLLYTDKTLKKKDPGYEQKIYPSQTKEISRLKSWGNQFITRFDKFAPAKDTSRVTGLAADSCWLFKVLPGKISAYSFLSEPEAVYLGNPPAMQFGNNSVEKLTPEALQAYIKDDEKAYKAFLKKDYYKAIKQFNKSHQ